MSGRLLVLVSCLILAVPSSAAITGVVMNADGQAIAGARVAAYARETAEDRRVRLASDTPERTPLAEAATDAKGRFSLETPKDHAVVLVQIDASAYGPQAMLVERDDTIGAIGLSAAPERTGRITAGGKPVAGARVVWSSQAESISTTDEEGRYSVADPSKWASTVTVIHPQYAVLAEPRAFGNAPVTVDRTLQNGAPVSGRVVSRDGKTPVAGAAVRINGWQVAASGDDGTFRATRVPLKWQWIEARTDTLMGEAAQGANVTIRTQPTIVVRGTVRDSKSQQPIGGTDVALARGTFFTNRPADSALADVKGNFTLTHVAPGSYRILASRPGYDFSPVTLSVAAGGKPAAAIAGTRQGRVSGVVMNEKKEPVGGAHLSVHAVSRRDMFSGPPMMMTAPGVGRITAPDGTFRMYVTTDSDLEIAAQKKGFPTARSSALKLEPGELKTGVLLTIPAGISVSGTVTDRDGKPVAGVTVTPMESRQSFPGQNMIVGRPGQSGDDALIRTSETGAFALLLKEGRYNIRFRADGFAAKTVRAYEVNARATPLEVVLDPGAELSGRVTRDGVGLADVRVGVFGEGISEQTTTEADGSFRLSNLTPGDMMLNAAKLDEFIQHHQRVRAPAHDITIEVPAGGRVTGRVVDKETKQPVTTFEAGLSGERGGGGFRFVGPPQTRPFTTDDGTFVLENVPVGPTTLIVNAVGYTAANIANVNVEVGKTAEVEVALERGVTVTGRVTDPSGSALAGVSVRLAPPQSRGPMGGRMSMPVMTDANGEYSLESLPAGEQTLLFARSGYVALPKKVELSGRKVQVDAQLSTGISVRGVVLNASGAPVAEAHVMASSPSAGPSGASTRTDQNGAFEMEALAPGRYTFRAQKEGYAPAQVQDIDVASGAPVRLVLESGGVIFGRVSGLAPDELTQASVSASGAGGSASAAVDASGSYRIEGAPVGTLRVTARFGGFASAGRNSPPKSVEVTAGAPVQVDLEFISGASIRGRVTRNGRPVPNARVMFSPREAQAQTAASAHSDPQGMYEVTGLTDAPYNVTVSDMGRMAGYTTTYDVRGSGTLDIDMRASTLRGRVVESGSSEPIADAAVELRRRDEGTVRYSAGGSATDSSGAFTLPDVGFGEYQLTTTKQGYGARVMNIDVGDSPADITIELSREDGITVRVVDARDGRDLSAAIRILDSQNRVVSESFMRMGAAEPVTIGLSPGSYRAVVMVPGYATRNLQVTSPGPVTVPMSPGGTIVIRSRGSEIQRARLMTADGRPYVRSFGNEFFAVDPSPGVTQLERIAPGAYTIQLLGPGGEVTSSAQVLVTEGGRVEVDL